MDEVEQVTFQLRSSRQLQYIFISSYYVSCASLPFQINFVSETSKRYTSYDFTVKKEGVTNFKKYWYGKIVKVCVVSGYTIDCTSCVKKQQWQRSCYLKNCWGIFWLHPWSGNLEFSVNSCLLLERIVSWIMFRY